MGKLARIEDIHLARDIQAAEERLDELCRKRAGRPVVTGEGRESESLVWCLGCGRDTVLMPQRRCAECV